MNIIPNMLVKSTCVEDSLKIKKKDNLTRRLFMYLVQYKQGLIIGSVSSPNALAPLGDQVEFLLMLVISIRYQAEK